MIGLILGPYLPSRPISEHDGVTIGPLADEIRQGLRKSRGIMGSVSDEKVPQLFSARAPYLQVDSRWGFEIPVEARSAKAAQEYAQREVIPGLAAALHTLGRTPYRFEIVYVLDPLDPDSARRTPMQDMGTFGYVWVDPLTTKRRTAFRRRRALILGDATASAAAEHLNRGVALDDLSDPAGAAHAAAVLSYYLCIERIAQNVAKGSRKRRKSDLDRRRAAAGTRLAVQIEGRSGQSAVLAIEDAARELRALDLRLADLELREAAVTLRIDDASAEEAVALNAFRSRHLAHSSLPPRDLVQQWLAGPTNRAFTVTARFLGAYLDSLDEPH